MGELNYPRLQGEGFEITGRLEVDLTHSHSFIRHSCAGRNPVSFFSVLDSRFHGNDSFDVIVFTCSWSASFQSCEGYVTKDWPTISQIFPSPQGEGFPPSPKGDINPSPKIVIPAKVGIQYFENLLDAGLIPLTFVLQGRGD